MSRQATADISHTDFIIYLLFCLEGKIKLIFLYRLQWSHEKVKLSVFLIKHHAMKDVRGTGRIVSRIFNVSTRWK
jgi:hypothetical protein